MLAQAQSYAKFLIAQLVIIGRKVRRKIAFVVASPAADSAFEQPIAHTIFGKAAGLTRLVQQGRNVNGIPEPACQRRISRWLSSIH